MLPGPALFLAHAGDASAGWIAWLPYGVALVLAVGVSVAADTLFGTRTFGGGHARRFATLAGLIAVASALGLAVFHAVNVLLVH